MSEQERVRAVQRMVADKVTDEMLRTPIEDLKDWEVAVINAALRGPFGDEIIERIDRFRP